MIACQCRPYPGGIWLACDQRGEWNRYVHLSLTLLNNTLYLAKKKCLIQGAGVPLELGRRPCLVHQVVPHGLVDLLVRWFLLFLLARLRPPPIASLPALQQNLLVVFEDTLLELLVDLVVECCFLGPRERVPMHAAVYVLANWVWLCWFLFIERFNRWPQSLRDALALGKLFVLTKLAECSQPFSSQYAFSFA